MDSSELYRTLTLSGGFTVNYRGSTSPPCSGGIQTQVVGVYSGVCSFNVDSCVETDGGQLALTVSGDPICSSAVIPTCDFYPADCGGTLTPPTSGVTTTIVSQTVKQQSVDVPCDPSFNFLETAAADGMIVLSDLDTATDAIARLLAGSGGTWSAWAVPADGTFCTSEWGVNDIPGGFTYQEAQFRYGATGLMPSTSYTLTLDVYQSVHGAGLFTMIGTISSSFTTDGSGNATITGDVPIAQGYDTYVTNPVVT